LHWRWIAGQGLEALRAGRLGLARRAALLLQALLFVSSPVISGYSRMQEHAADIYGLEVIHGLVPNSAEVAAQAFQVLGELDLSSPIRSVYHLLAVLASAAGGSLGSRIVTIHGQRTIAEVCE